MDNRRGIVVSQFAVEALEILDDTLKNCQPFLFLIQISAVFLTSLVFIIP